MHVRRTLALSLVLFFAVSSSQASAAAGDLDISFNDDGRTTTSFGNGAQAQVVAMQGKKIVVGGTTTKTTDDFALVRYTASGDRDFSFGNKGRVSVDFGLNDALLDLAVLSNGEILAVGGAGRPGSGSRFAIARFTADGKLDKTFGGGDGKVTTSFGDLGAGANAVVMLSGGRFAVAGNTGDPGGTRFAVARYLPGGKLDGGFGGDGRVVTGLGSGVKYAMATDLVRVGSDWLLAVGQALPGSGSNSLDLALAQYRADGSLDPFFGGGDGKTVENFYDFEYANFAVAQKNGFTLVGGYADAGAGWDAMFVRFNASGHVDSAWGGGDGIVTQDVGTTLEYWNDGRGSGGPVVVVGSVDGDAAVMRILKSGALDTSFGGVGWVATPFSGGDSTLRAVTIQENGRIVAAGQAPATLVADGFAVERLLAA